MLNDKERNVLEFVVFHTYNCLDEKGHEARIPFYMIQANFFYTDLNDILNKLVKLKYITKIIWNSDKKIGTRCTNKGANISKAILHISKDKSRILVCNKGNIYIKSGMQNFVRFKPFRGELK